MKTRKINLLLSITIGLTIIGVMVASVSIAKAAHGLDTNIRQVKTEDNPTVYYLDHERGLKKAYINEQAYLSYGNKWSDIVIVSQPDLDKWPDIYLVKTTGNPAVYNIFRNKKSVITTEDEFKTYGFNWNDIVTITQADLNSYELTELRFGGGPNPASQASLDVGLAITNPESQFIPANTQDNLVAVFKFNSIRGITRINDLTLKFNGVFNSQIIDQVELRDMNEDVYRYENVLSSGKQAFFNLNNKPLVINPGNTKLIGVYVDLGNYEDSTNHNFNVAIIDADSVSADTKVYGDFPVQGEIMKIIDSAGTLGQVLVEQRTASYESVVVIGNSNYALAKYEISEISNIEGLIVKKIVFKNYGSAGTKHINNFKLKNSRGMLISEVFDINEGREIIFSLENYEISKGGNDTFTVYADVIEGENKTIRIAFKEALIIGEYNNYGLKPQVSHTSEEFIITREKLGVLNKALTSNNKVFKEQSGTIIGLFDIRTDNQVIKLENASLSLVKNSLARELTQPVYLIDYDTGEVINIISAGQLGDNATVYFNMRELEAKSNLVLAIVTEIPEASADGATYQVNLNNITYWGDNRTLYVDEVIVNGEILEVKRSSLYIYDNDSLGEMPLIKGVKNAKIASFILEASGSRDVNIDSITITKGNTSGSVTYDNGFSNLRLYIGSKKVGNTITRPYNQTNIFTGINYRLKANKRAELKVYADLDSGLKISETVLLISNLAAKSSGTNIKANVEGIGTRSYKAKFRKLEIKIDNLNGGEINPSEDMNLIASFSVENSGEETISLKKITLDSTGLGLSSSIGYNDLKIIERSSNRRIGLVSSPVSGANVMSLNSYKIYSGNTLFFDVFIDASASVPQDNLELNINDLVVKGFSSKLYQTAKNEVSVDVVINTGDEPEDGGDEGFIWPVNGYISYDFLDQDYLEDFGVEHYGIDIVVRENTEIKATRSGLVIAAVDLEDDYSFITIEHDNNLKTVYGHVSQVSVEVGDTVAQGQIIGYSGGVIGGYGSGYNTSGPHLHFEVQLNNKPVNPLDYLQ